MGNLNFIPLDLTLPLLLNGFNPKPQLKLCLYSWGFTLWSRYFPIYRAGVMHAGTRRTLLSMIWLGHPVI